MVGKGKRLGELSQLDPGQVLKNVHDELGSALSVSQANSQVPAGYSKVVLTSDANGSVTEAVFYAGTAAEKTRIKCVADVGGSLNNTYFYLSNADNDPEFYIWYNVDNTGTDPNIAGKCGIEITIQANDSAAIVALATRRTLEVSKYFKVETNGDHVLLVENEHLGTANNSLDVSTGFFITTTVEGVTERIKCIKIPQVDGVRYVFNHAEGKFETHVTEITVSVESGDSVDTPNILNVSAVLSSTEYNFVLPATTKRYQFKIRGNGAVKVQYCFVSGQTNTNYFTLDPGNVNYEEGLSMSTPLTFYFETSKSGQILEVKYWT